MVITRLWANCIKKLFRICVFSAQISSSYVCLATNAVGSAMARTDLIVVASRADAEQMKLMQRQDYLSTGYARPLFWTDFVLVT